jgi:hypothetical protein
MYDYLAKIVLLGPSGAGKYVSRRGGGGGENCADGCVQIVCFASVCEG